MPGWPRVWKPFSGEVPRWFFRWWRTMAAAGGHSGDGADADASGGDDIGPNDGTASLLLLPFLFSTNVLFLTPHDDDDDDDVDDETKPKNPCTTTPLFL